ncbi:MAG: heptosyltransferase-1 [Pseudohongiellaceae bacterium]|jgi:heptosyltransferase-1
MRVLVIKTSSMGDVIHTLPALNDAVKAIPGIRFDWVVEEGFDEIPSWHPAVEDVIPVAIRRWRKSIFQAMRSAEWKQCKQMLRQRHYDCVIDAQGLLKSAWLARYTRAPRFGYDKESVRERLATFVYHHKINVPKKLHAVERTRRLFAESLGYKLPQQNGNAVKGTYGIDKSRFKTSGEIQPNIVFLHGTTRHNKHWPEDYWVSLCKKICAQGYKVYLPWGNEVERNRAKFIAQKTNCAEVLPKLNIRGVACVLAKASAVVAVDTGLGHLTAALNIPAISLYGTTSPDLVGAYGENQIHLCAKDFPAVSDTSIDPFEMAALTPEIVADKLLPLLPVISQPKVLG